MIGSAAVFGPMFLLGLFALSDVLRLATSRLIEHWISNLMAPLCFFSLYQLLSLAISSGDWADYTILGVYFIYSLILMGI